MPSVDLQPIAIVGIACRAPQASGPEEFWQLAWEGLEDAGVVVTPDGSPNRISVFLGVMAADYGDLVAMAGTGGISRHTLTGVGRAIIANRASHTLSLRGTSPNPGIALDELNLRVCTGTQPSTSSVTAGNYGYCAMRKTPT